ncbi:putative pol Retrovirus-related Pol polyprotein from transposon-like 20 [Homarus americanus]|uniref:Putative pol Retrovirus-related Pol polyprotein from transposon-like 20 n=1 Tax=Homarus americanus TaxID=6706 RepID=A0A8J5TLG5_HOMAM|nr:putative pol Retrovirus-related Pol polyprotein from transposon-like 20 [Homarus americanus]
MTIMLDSSSQEFHSLRGRVLSEMSSECVDSVDGSAGASWPIGAQITKSSTNHKRRRNELRSTQVILVCKQKMEGPTAKKRRPNFSEEEVYAMVCEVAKKKENNLRESPREGPYTVVEHLSDVTYRSKGGRKAQQKVVHFNRLWQYHGPGQYTWEVSEELSPTTDEDQIGDPGKTQGRTIQGTRPWT